MASKRPKDGEDGWQGWQVRANHSDGLSQEGGRGGGSHEGEAGLSGAHWELSWGSRWGSHWGSHWGSSGLIAAHRGSLRLDRSASADLMAGEGDVWQTEEPLEESVALGVGRVIVEKVGRLVFVHIGACDG